MTNELEQIVDILEAINTALEAIAKTVTAQGDALKALADLVLIQRASHPQTHPKTDGHAPLGAPPENPNGGDDE
jgi:hypothetical protein